VILGIYCRSNLAQAHH